MKYAVDLKRVETRTIHIFAASPQEAVQRALEGWPKGCDFRAEAVTDLLDGDKEGDCRLVVGCCEACQKPLLDGDFSEDDDGVKVCSACSSAHAVSG